MVIKETKEMEESIRGFSKIKGKNSPRGSKLNSPRDEQPDEATINALKM